MIYIYIIFGLTVGFIFGYILTRTGITKYSHVMGMLLLKDFKILKFMLTAVTSSMILFYLLGDLSLIKLSPKSFDWGKVAGGLIFGTGMALLGYCPGTMAARIGEGKKEAILALFGMNIGIVLFAITISPIKLLFPLTEISGNIKVLFSVNHWLIVIPAALFFASIIYLINKKYDDKNNVFIQKDGKG